MKTREHGFTVIELVVVIAILGILAAVALPRFASLTNDAYEAKLEGTQGGFASAVVIAHSAWLTRPNPAGAVVLEGGTVLEMHTTTGWPRISATQDATLLYNRLMSTTLDSSFTTASVVANTASYVLTAYMNANNRILYTQATGAVTIP